jgi:deoxyribose-phosphate aldolase
MDRWAERRTGPVKDPGALSPEDLAALIDHTALKPEAGAADIRRLCEEALARRFAAVCVNPGRLRLASSIVRGSGVAACAVIGFPLGASRPDVKAFEVSKALEDGADELDMVVDLGALIEGDEGRVRAGIRAVVDAAEGRLVKVILETCLLDDARIETGCRLAREGGARFVKTSTGFGAAGAKEAHVRLMRRAVGEGMGVKAAGGIRDHAAALAMIAAGANRIGASASVAIVDGYRLFLQSHGPGV